MTWIAMGAAAFFLVRSEKQLATLRADGRAFDLRAREAADTLADLRSAQQAYVAAGQGVAFWMPKVAQISESVGKSIAVLRASATSTAARSAIDDATALLALFVDVDRRAGDYLKSGQQLMAGDVIFTEGDQTAASAARQVETARLAEHQAFDSSEAGVRKQEAAALAAAGGLTAVIVLLLGLLKMPDTTALPASGAPQAWSPAAENQLTGSPVLKAAAGLCTDFGCVRDIDDLQVLLARAGDMMDAAGLVVWLGSTSGADLRPVFTHGYSDEVRARLPNVPRSADNAAAAAYRSREVQLVLSQPGGPRGLGGLTGAIVAPIMSAEGCIGALSAEIRDGGEASETVRALAAIIAAQLAGVLSTPRETADDRVAASS